MLDRKLLNLQQDSKHAPRILMLYGSLRGRSYSKLLTLEAARLLEVMGAEVKIFDLSNDLIACKNSEPISRS